MEHVYGLQRADHDLEMGDEAVIVAANHVDAVDRNAVDDGFEFKHRRVFAVPFADIFEICIAQSVARGGEIFGGEARKKFIRSILCSCV